MEIQSIRRVLHPDPAEAKRRPRSLRLLILALAVVCSTVLCSCGKEGEPIDKPDEFTRVYQAHEKYILRAIHQTLKEKGLGRAIINTETHEVTSDYIVHGEWRTRSLARIIQVNQNEREVALSIITEKRTPAGWELRRLLGKEHYERLFDAIDTQIYREMSRPD
jgi:hypothetical protein